MVFSLTPYTVPQQVPTHGLADVELAEEEAAAIAEAIGNKKTR